MRSLFPSLSFNTMLMLVMVLVIGIVAPSAKAGTGMSMGDNNSAIQNTEIDASPQMTSNMSNVYCDQKQNQLNSSDIDCVLSCSIICVSPAQIPEAHSLLDREVGSDNFVAIITNRLSFSRSLATPPPRA